MNTNQIKQHWIEEIEKIDDKLSTCQMEEFRGCSIRKRWVEMFDGDFYSGGKRTKSDSKRNGQNSHFSVIAHNIVNVIVKFNQFCIVKFLFKKRKNNYLLLLNLLLFTKIFQFPSKTVFRTKIIKISFNLTFGIKIVEFSFNLIFLMKMFTSIITKISKL